MSEDNNDSMLTQQQTESPFPPIFQNTINQIVQEISGTSTQQVQTESPLPPEIQSAIAQQVENMGGTPASDEAGQDASLFSGLEQQVQDIIALRNDNGTVPQDEIPTIEQLDAQLETYRTNALQNVTESFTSIVNTGNGKIPEAMQEQYDTAVAAINTRIDELQNLNKGEDTTPRQQQTESPFPPEIHDAIQKQLAATERLDMGDPGAIERPETPAAARAEVATRTV